ncbi:hypothetical protein OS493_027287 [Desmophyllum pertusum]|uniref:Secreted protein n=1 Tax=Desmophyllum pertusum TaxID=174260 RepID=A0A9W9ZAF6_9CNID|nr:hypothetical protein OS493_027287 [Desmophyllum pertusum]
MVLHVITLRVILIVVVAVEWRVTADRLQRNQEKVPLSALTGQPKKITYRPATDDLAVSALKFGKWTKNNSLIEQTDYFVIGSNREKKRFWLRIKKVSSHDSGLYSFMVNDTVVKQWLLQVKDFLKKLKKPVCGRPLKKLASVCVAFSESDHPNCLSFPGPPLNLKVSLHLHEGYPIVQVKWNPPNTGKCFEREFETEIGVKSTALTDWRRKWF